MIWIERKGLTALDRKLVMQAGPSAVRPVVRARAALAKLVEFGWLQTSDDRRYGLSEAALVELKLPSTPSAETTTEAQPLAAIDSAASS